MVVSSAFHKGADHAEDGQASGVTPVMEVQRQQWPSTFACTVLAVCILALLHGASAGLFPQGSSVLQLTHENFDAELGKARPVLIAFYAPWCA